MTFSRRHHHHSKLISKISIVVQVEASIGSHLKAMRTLCVFSFFSSGSCLSPDLWLLKALPRSLLNWMASFGNLPLVTILFAAPYVDCTNDISVLRTENLDHIFSRQKPCDAILCIFCEYLRQFLHQVSILFSSLLCPCTHLVLLSRLDAPFRPANSGATQ